MPEYLCLLYAEDDGDEAVRDQRLAERPEWEAVTEDLRAAGMLVANRPLHGVDSATTVRVGEREVELADGPFAITKEILAGFYLLRCRDLDEAIAQAARLPTARYGSVEVRPVVDEAALWAGEA